MDSGPNKAEELAALRASHDELRAELEAVRSETARLRAEVARERRTTQAVRGSLSFRLGSMLIQAVSRPGRNTVLLPYRLLRLGVKTIRGQAMRSTQGASARKAYVLQMVRDRIDDIRLETGSARKHYLEPRRKDLKIAAIMDRFTYDCFRHEADLITFTPDNWKRVLSRNRPHLLLVESAWRGHDDSWLYQVVNLEQKPDSQLPELVQWCKAQGIPTAFWNKEDPAHYEDFLEAARLFDHVYTSDMDCIPEYRGDLGHDNVHCLAFAVQPRVHNPIGSGQKIRDVAFAGSWYEGETEYRKHRKEQMSCVLLPSLQYDVDIYNRHQSSRDAKYRFPDEYQPYIVGQLAYEEMVYAYKIYRVFLNVSSVVDSPTMFPRRVLEILASGTCVVSGYCKGIDNLLGQDIVPMSSSPEETELLLKRFLPDSELRGRLAHLGLRKVMREHTCEQRLDYVLDTMGITKTASASKPGGVSIITCTNKPMYMENILANYDRQQYGDKELIIVLNSDRLNLDDWVREANQHQNVRVYQLPESERLGACLNYGVEKGTFDHIAKFDDDDYYAPAYLEDMMAAFDYSGADIVGKSAHYVYFENGATLAIQFADREHCFTEFIAGPTLLIRRDVFSKVRFRPDKGPGEDTQFLKDCMARGFRIYSADRFNFVRLRTARVDLHTWRESDDEQLSKCHVVAGVEDYVEHVTC